jgi:hypothetical protein
MYRLEFALTTHKPLYKNEFFLIVPGSAAAAAGR